jgi:hypothetical protein
VTKRKEEQRKGLTEREFLSVCKFVSEYEYLADLKSSGVFSGDGDALIWHSLQTTHEHVFFIGSIRL